MRTILATAALALMLGAPVAAQTTADMVKDRESLRDFVTDAKRHIESLRDYNDVIALREGDYIW